MKTSVFFSTVIIFLVIIITSLFATNYRDQVERKEGFSYTDCRNKGFTSEFCVQTPIATSGVGTCLCDDGTYKTKCCNGTLRAQGVGKTQA